MAADESKVAVAPTADPQDPLPESNWRWRRIFVFSAGALITVGIGVVLAMLYSVARFTLEGRQSVETTLATIEALYGIAWWLVILSLVDRVLYMIAPSAEQATKMLATVSAWKGGISTASLSRSSIPGGGTTETSVTAGPAATPPVAPPAPYISPPPITVGAEVDVAPTSVNR